MTLQEILSLTIIGITIIAFIVGLSILINNLRRRHRLNSVKLPDIEDEQVDLTEVFKRKSIKSYKIPTVNSDEVQKIIDSEVHREDNLALEEMIKSTEKRYRNSKNEDVQLPEIEDVKSNIKESFNKMFAEMGTR